MSITDEQIKDLRGNKINNGDLCIRTSFADKKSVLVYCIVFEDRAFYVRPNWRTSTDDLLEDIMHEDKPITSCKFEQYQIVKLNVLGANESVIAEKLLHKLANFEGKGNFSHKYVKMAQEFISK